MNEQINSHLDSKSSLTAMMLASKKKGVLEQAFQIIQFLLGIMAMPARLMVREKFGERIFSFMSFIAMIFLHVYLPFLIAQKLLPPTDYTSYTPVHWMITIGALITPYTGYLYLLIRLGSTHFKSVVHRNQKGEYVHSSFRGISRGIGRLQFKNKPKKEKKAKWGLKLDDDYVRTFREPFTILGLCSQICLTVILICSLIAALLLVFLPYIIFEIIAGICIWILCGFVFIYLSALISSLALFFDELSYFLRKRNAALDLLDAEKDMEELQNYRVYEQEEEVGNEEFQARTL